MTGDTPMPRSLPAVDVRSLGFWAAAVVLLVAIGCIAWRAALPFDAAYNLLPYKNWVETGRFERHYADDVDRFDPAVSTGPTVNAPIALFYLIARTPDAFFQGAAVVVVFYWALFLATLFVLHRRDHPSLMLVLTIGLLAVGRQPVENMSYFVPLGELPSAVLILAGLVLFASPRPHAGVLASLVLGLAVLTKTQVLGGLALPALFEVGRRALRGRFPLALGDALIVGLVLLPVLAWRFALPAAALDAKDYRTYLARSSERARFEREHAFRNLNDVVQVLAHGDEAASVSVARRWSEKLSVVELAKRGGPGALAFLLVGLAATAWLLASRVRSDRAVGHFGLFGLSILAWWLFASGLPWYRHLFVADLALSVVIAHAAATSYRRRIAEASPLVGVALGGALYGAALIASATGLPGTGASILDLPKRVPDQERAVLDFARRVESLDPDRSAVHGLGWQQAPQVQLLARNDFRDFFDRGDVRASIDAGKTIFLVQTPDMIAYADEFQHIQPAVKEVLFDRDGFRLLWLDATRTRKILEGFREGGDSPWH